MDDNTRSPLTKNPTINLPPEPSTVNYEAQDEKDDSEYQVLWSQTMDKGKYRNSSTYTNIEVLLLCWAESSDDLAVKEEVSRLKGTFETRFNYHTQIAYLDANIERKPQVQINTIVAAFIGAHDGPTTLLIVYYAGHGKPGSYYGSLVLQGQTSENDQRQRLDLLVWNKTEQLLDDADADVLEIFDCCYAGNLGLTRGQPRLFEYLAATKEMATTRVPGEDSFTSALIYALEALVEEKGMFTTVELLRKIKSHAPNFPSDQIPVLSDRRDDAQAGRIMLHPLHRNQEDGSRTAISSEETSNLNALKRHTVTLHFDFANKPPSTDIEILGRHLNQNFERSTLGVNRVRWGGMKRSAAARAVGSFQAGLQRSRRASMKRHQAALDLATAESWLAGKSSELLTPSSSGRDSPQALELAATGSVGVNPPIVNVISFPNSSSSNEESDDGHILVRRVRNKKQKSDTDGEEAS